MKRLIVCLSMMWTTHAYCTNYSCAVFKNSQQITTLPGSLPDNSPARGQNNIPVDPNIALAYTLCQQAGFQLISTQVTIPGLRGSPSGVTKIQQFPDPACTLKCTVVS